MILTAAVKAALPPPQQPDATMSLCFELPGLGDIEVYWKPVAHVFVILGEANQQDTQTFGLRGIKTACPPRLLAEKLRLMVKAIEARNESQVDSEATIG